MSFDPGQFRIIIERTLTHIAGMNSPEAVDLLMGTSAQESHLGRYLFQVGGPAKGVFQMEPATEEDIWGSYLGFRPSLSQAVTLVTGISGPDSWALTTDLAYQIVMARIHYRRVKEPLPAVGDLEGQAKYWKKYFNTPGGKGHPEEYVQNYNRYVKGKY
jgi:hypothetical protein